VNDARCAVPGDSGFEHLHGEVVGFAFLDPPGNHLA
jgi:hypothetical protein